MGRAERDKYTKGRSFPEHAGDLDRCPVQLDQLLHQSQADTRPFMRTAVSNLYAMEALEQTWQLLLGNAYACVGHFEHRVGVASHNCVANV